ncbi:MAG: cupin domain-containing protein [Verrucomicrobia bacterium]|nr:cupin domain-containing protein [Verrucomicrobiota bacterium]MBV8486120.1 cupin domain-containing protein [Verrucomicrobiota bacterium]
MKRSSTGRPDATVTDTIRRVVTTHDPNGKTILLTDDRIPLPAFAGGKAKGAVLWTTGTVPADNIGDVQGEKRAAGMSLKGGSVLRITEFGPGFVSPMHRTLSIDYAVVLSGMLDLLLDGGEAVKLRPGDAVIQRGTSHAWHNPSADQPCRIMIAMIEAHPITIAGKRLRQTPTWRMIASVLAGTLRRASTYNVAKEKGRPLVATGIWRVLTGHDASGKAVVLSEQEIDSLPCPALNATRAVLWKTERVPADNKNDENPARAVGSASPYGSAFSIIELTPASLTKTRVDPSIDYCVVLSGEAELILDDGNGVLLSAGDVAVLRGTRQAWRNPSPNTSCHIAVCTIEARKPAYPNAPAKHQTSQKPSMSDPA